MSSVFRAISFWCSIFEGSVLQAFEKCLKVFKTAEIRCFFAFVVLVGESRGDDALRGLGSSLVIGTFSLKNSSSGIPWVAFSGSAFGFTT